ncbi:hypothetical protein [Rubellicoccus peritrichatus]|uniref:PEP-CTERM protein-sorting domain-containing protein n=1 Tax=Rubellicoccus peritrichatus TaxID=3080537 RepID=A0AAQ3LF93_9BACT|nr:hypothetical protein [Puniceicoccus sp. CR14]WOO42628.1 hypothetical protein RZN69_05955 [Puniceicoccus sp. CR14]
MSSKLNTKATQLGLSALISASASQLSNATITPSPTVGPGGLRPPATDGRFGWDVDGDGTVEFHFENDQSSIAFLQHSGNVHFLHRVSTNSATDIIPIPDGKTVGAAVDGYQFTTANYLTKSVTQSGAMALDFYNIGWNFDQSGFLGFEFQSNGQTHYAWAEWTIDGTTNGANVGQGFIINRAYFESDPGVSIVVGALPEPETTATGLALLALGTAGLHHWRTKRKKV